jgi:putative membrane protein
MKKLSLVFMMFVAAYGFQACGDSNSNNDTVENAKEQNEDVTGIAEDDSKFMVKAASGGMMEVELGQLAQQKAQNKRVKDFGAMMVKDHTKANEEMKALAANKNVTLPQAMGEDHQKHVTDLREKTGKAFDKAYMSMMVDDHQEDVNDFENISTNGKDADLKAFAAKTLPVLRTHLESAKSINDAIK